MTPVLQETARRARASTHSSQLEPRTGRRLARSAEFETADPRLPLRPQELERLHLFTARAEAGMLLRPDVRAAVRDLLDSAEDDARRV